MGWLTDGNVPQAGLFALEEAELTPGNPQGRIGWVQAGGDDAVADALRGTASAGWAEERLGPWRLGWRTPPPSLDQIRAIPPLMQCVDDALHRYGEVDADAVLSAAGQARTLRGLRHCDFSARVTRLAEP